MRIPNLLWMFFFLGLSGCPLAQNQQARLQQELADVGLPLFTASDYKPGLVKHIVLLQYAPGVSDETQQEVIDAFLALKKTLRNGNPYIKTIDVGEQSSGEGVDRGYTQGFIVTFESEGDRNYYVGSPIVNDANYYDQSHAAFKTFVAPLLATPNGVLVFDFTIKLDK